MFRLSTGILALGFGSIVAHAAPTPAETTPAANTLGYVDLQRAVQAVEAGKKAKKTLASEFEAKKKEVERKQEALKQMNDEFEKKSLVMNEKTRQEKQVEFQKRAVEFQQFLQESQNSMQEREKELTQPILEEMEVILKDIASEKKLAMILEKNRSAVLYAPAENDYTDVLIQRYEAKAKKK